jgi:prefoldin subunit 5
MKKTVKYPNEEIQKIAYKINALSKEIKKFNDEIELLKNKRKNFQQTKLKCELEHIKTNERTNK